MNAKISHPIERDAQWIQAYRDELVERISQAVGEDGTIEPLKGVRFHRSSLPNEPIHSVSEPHFAVIAQGSKEIYLGDNLLVEENMSNWRPGGEGPMPKPDSPEDVARKILEAAINEPAETGMPMPPLSH